jgi:hypothetical protein
MTSKQQNFLSTCPKLVDHYSVRQRTDLMQAMNYGTSAWQSPRFEY